MSMATALSGQLGKFYSKYLKEQIRYAYLRIDRIGWREGHKREGGGPQPQCIGL